jgi:VanZ family protein
MALIFVLSMLDTNSVMVRWHIDKFMHAGAYGVMGLLGYDTVIRIWSSLEGIKAGAIVFVLCTLFGALIELFQGMTGYRVFSYGDMVANGVGALIGVIIAAYLGLERGRR